MEKRIYLIGYMASGKTTIGKELAEKLGYDFYDQDELMEKASGKTIADMFDLPDGKAFREVERQTLHQTFSFSNAIIACGGGTPCFFDNMDEMKKHGLVIWVKPSIGIIIERLRTAKHSRPLLAGQDDRHLHEKVIEHYHGRETFYQQAHLIFNPEEENIKELSKKINDIHNA